MKRILLVVAAAALAAGCGSSAGGFNLGTSGSTSDTGASGGSGSSGAAAGSGGSTASASSSGSDGSSSSNGSTGASSSSTASTGGGSTTSTDSSGSGSGSTGIECPPPDPTTTIATLPAFNGPPDYPIKASGEVTAYALPRLPPGKHVEWIAFGETPRTYSPSPYLLTASYSPCPGVFVPQTGPLDHCSGTSSQTNGSTWYWVEDENYVSTYGACYAPPNVQYYFNVKWTYTTCAQGVAECGFSLSTGG